ncbi:hypothetical protein C0992_001659 [Termitomyces sp. T32_za158]|nr:hypothetical protein C0992_001659 [Termitomyces sp. T32_za158]
MADCSGPAVVLTTSTLPARPPATPVQAAPTISPAHKVPLAELLLEQQDEEMINAPLIRTRWRWWAQLKLARGPSHRLKGASPPSKLQIWNLWTSRLVSLHDLRPHN